MTLPVTREADSGKLVWQTAFGGLDMRLSAADGAVAAMENMSGDHAPALSCRPARRKIRTLEKANGLAAGDKLCWADGTGFYYDGVLKGTVTDGAKTFCFLNSHIVIWPDKKAYNTATDEFGALEASVTTEGELYGVQFMSLPAPDGVSDTANALLFDGTALPGFAVNDAVTISGCIRHAENNKTLVIRRIVGQALYFYDGSFVLDRVLTYTAADAGLAAGDYALRLDGAFYRFTVQAALAAGDRLAVDVTAMTMTQTAAGAQSDLELTMGGGDLTELAFAESAENCRETACVTVKRAVPDFEFLTQSGNRLWGAAGNELWCSYLGDPRVWYNFDDTATACFQTQVGSAGAFTGAYTYGGTPMFFKEDRVYRVYGTKPSVFRVQETVTQGCEAGSENSFAVVGQTLFYKTPCGFAAYGGGAPRLVDGALGAARRQNAVAGSDGARYYVCCAQGEEKSLFVYDARSGLWHREDAADVKSFARCGGGLYMLAGNDVWLTGRIRARDGVGEGAVNSVCVFAPFDSGSPRRQYVRRLFLRARVDGALRVSVRYDDASPWQSAALLSGGAQTVELPVQRCGRLQLRLDGTGDWKLMALGREYADGGTG